MPHTGGRGCFTFFGRQAVMVTWMELLTFALVVVGIVGSTVGVIRVVIQIVTLTAKRKK